MCTLASGAYLYGRVLSTYSGPRPYQALPGPTIATPLDISNLGIYLSVRIQGWGHGAGHVLTHTSSRMCAHQRYNNCMQVSRNAQAGVGCYTTPKETLMA